MFEMFERVETLWGNVDTYQYYENEYSWSFQIIIY